MFLVFFLWEVFNGHGNFRQVPPIQERFANLQGSHGMISELQGFLGGWQAQRADVVPEVWFVLRGTQVGHRGLEKLVLSEDGEGRCASVWEDFFFFHRNLTETTDSQTSRWIFNSEAVELCGCSPTLILVNNSLSKPQKPLWFLGGS